MLNKWKALSDYSVFLLIVISLFYYVLMMVMGLSNVDFALFEFLIYLVYQVIYVGVIALLIANVFLTGLLLKTDEALALKVLSRTLLLVGISMMLLIAVAIVF